MRLDEFLLDLSDELTRLGLPEMDDATLKEVAIRLTHPEARQMIESDQWTVEAIAKEIEAGMRSMGQGRGTEAPLIGQPGGAFADTPAPTTVPDYAVEGALIGDSSGAATDQLRKQNWRLQ